MKRTILLILMTLGTTLSHAQALDDNWDTVIDKLKKAKKNHRVEELQYSKYAIVTDSNLTYETIYSIDKELDQLQLISFIFYDAIAYNVWIEETEKNMIEISSTGESRKWYSRNMVKGKKICFLFVNPSEEEIKLGMIGKLRVSYVGSAFNNP